MTEESKRKQKPRPSLPNDEIDSRWGAAIRDRAAAMKQVSKLVHWQDRLARLEQEINSLIGFKQRLNGGTDSPVQYKITPILPISEPRPPFNPAPNAFPGHLAGNLDGVTSIPTKVANPKPSGANVADIVGEGGFS